MELRHVPTAPDGGDGSEERVVASDVELAESLLAQTKGLMFRDDVPEGYAMVFRFDDPPSWIPDRLGELRSIHMLFVTVPLDVVWLRDGVVEQVSTLSPWTGLGLARADTIVELPAGAAEDVDPGDRLELVGTGEPTD